MAVYGAAFCAAPEVTVVPPAAAAGSERRQQQQEQRQQRQQRRNDKRRRHDEKARQQHRQQRYQKAREAAAQLPADLAAAVPDVSGMKVAQLREFLQEVRRDSIWSYVLVMPSYHECCRSCCD
jgi:ABC-type Zn2+ transport system substrate-binding protein/surface adhesin